jgi:hypothetical protein
MVRNQVFAWVRSLARRRYDELPPGVAPVVAEALADYWAEHSEIRTDNAARALPLVHISEERDRWRVRQTLLDPEETGEWFLDAEVDLERSRSEEQPVLALVRIAQHGGHSRD